MRPWWLVVVAVTGCQSPDAPAPTPPAPSPPSSRAPPTVDRYGDPLPPMATARFGSARFRHGAGAAALAYSADGKHLATADAKTIVVWSTATGRREWETATGGITKLAWSPDGARLAASSHDGGVTVFARAGGSGWRADRTDDSVDDLAWSPDGERLAFVGVNHAMSVNGIAPAVGLWLLDGETGKPLRDFAYDAGGRAVTFAPDGALVVATPTGIDVIPARRSAVALHIAADEPHALGVTPDGTELFWLDRKAIGRYDLAAHKALPAFPHAGRGAELAVIAPSGTALALAADDGVYLLDRATGAVVRTLSTEHGEASNLVFSPSGARVTATWELGYSGQPTTWDVATGDEIVTPGQRSDIDSVDCVGDTVVTASRDGSVILWGLDGTPRLALPRLDHPVTHARFSRDGARLVTASRAAIVRVWDAKTGAPIEDLRHDLENVSDAAFLPDGRIASLGAQTVYIWRDGAIERRLETGRELAALAVSGDGAHVYAGSTYGFLWDAHTFAAPREIGYVDGDGIAAFTPDGASLWVGGYHELERVDVATGAADHRTYVAPGHRYGVAFAPDGSWLVATGEGGAVMYALPSRARLAQVDDQGWSAAACADGEHLIIGRIDGTSVVYSVRALLAAAAP